MLKLIAGVPSSSSINVISKVIDDKDPLYKKNRAIIQFYKFYSAKTLKKDEKSLGALFIQRIAKINIKINTEKNYYVFTFKTMKYYIFNFNTLA